MVNPAISVLMPVYDTPPALLDQAIASILHQTCGDFEFLILDDGSRLEETRLGLERWAAEDPRIRLFHEPHRGLTQTLNRGLSVARGEWIARQDADDWSAPERFSIQTRYLRNHPETCLAGTDTQLHRADGKSLWRQSLPRKPESPRTFLEGNPFVHGSTMFRRKLALRIGGYRKEFPCSQDYDFFWRMCEAGGGVNLDQVLYHYRYTGGSISVQRAADQARAHRAARILAESRKRGEQEDIQAALRTAHAETLPDALGAALKQADHRMLAGQFALAAKEYARLLRSNPGSGLAWAKMARLAAFAAIPPAREGFFR